MLKLSKTQQKTLHFSIAILGGLMAFALVASQPARAEAPKQTPPIDIPKIKETKCTQEIDVEVCLISYKDGTSEKTTEPLGTMRDGFGEAEKVAIEPTMTGSVYRDTAAAAETLLGTSK